VHLSYYASLVYFDSFLHRSPYLKRREGIGETERLKAAKTVKPQPYPRLSTRGLVVSGKKVPIRHLMTMTPVIAEAEYNPKASTTKAMTGIISSTSVNPKSPTDTRNRGTGRWK
jgi:hypothetical protein